MEEQRRRCVGGLQGAAKGAVAKLRVAVWCACGVVNPLKFGWDPCLLCLPPRPHPPPAALTGSHATCLMQESTQKLAWNRIVDSEPGYVEEGYMADDVFQVSLRSACVATL